MEAEEIKRQIEEDLRETLKLELSETKTLLTHATTEAAHFLGDDIKINRLYQGLWCTISH
jgi:hypothetical protein